MCMVHSTKFDSLQITIKHFLGLLSTLVPSDLSLVSVQNYVHANYFAYSIKKMRENVKMYANGTYNDKYRHTWFNFSSIFLFFTDMSSIVATKYAAQHKYSCSVIIISRT